MKSGQRAGDFVVIWKSDSQSALLTVKSDPYAPLPADLDHLLWLHWSTRAEKQSSICDDGITGSHEHLRATFRVISTANTELISEKQSAQSRTTSVFYSLFSDFRFAKKKKKERINWRSHAKKLRWAFPKAHLINVPASCGVTLTCATWDDCSRHLFLNFLMHLLRKPTI